MVKHIGIVGVTYPGALLCYEAICAGASKRMPEKRYREVTLHSFPGGDYMRAIRSADWPLLAELMVRSATTLAAAGADFALSPANTVHEVYEAVASASPIPWISIVEATADEAVKRGYQTVGVLGTAPVLERPFYRETLERKGVAMKVPDPAVAAEMQRLIFEELSQGVFTDPARAFLRETANALRADGCAAVVMACTEIPLALRQDDVVVPLLDSPRILAEAAIEEALR